MASLEEQFQKACEEREIPGVVLLASSSKSMLHQLKSKRSLLINIT